MNIETIYSLRSKMNCISKGIGYIIHRPWLTTKVMGPWALLVGCLFVIYRWMVDTISVSAQLTGVIDIADMLFIAVTFLLLCIANQLFIARMFVLFRRTQASVERAEIAKQINEGEDVEAVKTVTLTMKERILELIGIALCTLPYTIWGYIVACPFFGIPQLAYDFAASQPSYARTGLVAFGIIAGIVVIIFMGLSLTYPFYHYAMTIKNKRIEKDEMPFKKALSIGFHHKGKIFTVTLLSGFIVALLCILPSLPYLISNFAYGSAIISSVLLNDPAEIPASGMWFMFIASSISIAICALISLIPYASLLYLYGSITLHEREKASK